MFSWLNTLAHFALAPALTHKPDPGKPLIWQLVMVSEAALVARMQQLAAVAGTAPTTVATILHFCAAGRQPQPGAVPRCAQGGGVIACPHLHVHLHALPTDGDQDLGARRWAGVQLEVLECGGAHSQHLNPAAAAAAA
jgi:hypothetical protein